MAGLRPRDVPRHQPPGRALLLAPGGALTLQVAVPPTSHGWPEVLGQEPAGRPRPAPRAVPALPRAVDSRDLPAGCLGVTLADDGTALSPLTVGPQSPGLLVVGGPGSGRSTALAALAQALTEQGRTAVVVEHGAPLDEGTAATPDAVLLVDDAAAVPPALEDALVRHAEAGGVVVAACGTADAARAFRGLLAVLRDGRRALVLGPAGPAETDWLGIRIAVPAASLPGRGWLVDRGRASPLQVARPKLARGTLVR